MSRIMRAIRVAEFGGPEMLKLLTDVAVPSVSKGQVLVKLSAVGINPVDTYIRAGTYARKPALPYTPGNDGAGVVHVAGEGVTEFKPGDRVYITQSLTGTYAEYSLCDMNSIHKLPDSVSYSQGAALGVPYYTAYRALFHSLKVRPGETVLVHGASGGVGVAAVQFARAYGMVVIGTAGTAEGEDLVKQAGAHHVFNHRAADYTKGIMDATAGRGVDAVVEMLANVSLNKDLQLVARKGRIGVVGNRGTIEICPRDAMAKESSIVGVILSGASQSDRHEMKAAIHSGMEAGWLRPIVGKQFPLQQASEAHREIIEGKGAKGKMILTVGSDSSEVSNL